MKIIIPGQPIAKKRHKCGCRHNKPFAYDPQIKQEMESIRKQAIQQWVACFESDNPQIKMEASRIAQAQSFVVTCTFLFDAPKSLSQGQRNEYFWGLVDHNTKPDFDNLAKMYVDCLTGVIWEDDAKIIIGKSIKDFSYKPRTKIEIMPKQKLNIHPKAKEILKIFGPEKMVELSKDVKAFWPWDEERIDNLNTETKDEASLNSLACLLSEFCDKYADDFKKIKKHSGLLKELSDADLYANRMARGYECI